MKVWIFAKLWITEMLFSKFWIKTGSNNCLQEFVKEKPWGMKIALKKLDIQIRAASNNWYNRPKIRKSLEIKRRKNEKRKKVLNRDEGSLVKTNTWTPINCRLGKKQPTQRLDVNLENGSDSILYFIYVWKCLLLTKTKYDKIL